MLRERERERERVFESLSSVAHLFSLLDISSSDSELSSTFVTLFSSSTNLQTYRQRLPISRKQLKLSLLIFAALSTTLAHELPVRIPQPNLSLRSVVSTGSWSLTTDSTAASNTTCAADTAICGSRWLCPDSLAHITTASNVKVEVGIITSILASVCLRPLSLSSTQPRKKIGKKGRVL
jgi:hypothetical protein